jgi:uncharacterized phiE125 gp8 family phage protein
MIASDAIGLNAVAMGGQTPTTKVSSDLFASYAVAGSVSSDLSALYAVRAQVSADLSAAYAVSAQVSADLLASYSVNASVVSSVSTSLAIAYAICSEVSSDLAILFSIEEAVDYVRAPLGAVCKTQPAAYPDTLKRLGVAEAAVSLDAARRAARLDGDELDDEVLTAAIAYTEEAEHATSRAFVQQTWRAGFSAFSAEMILPKPPLISIAHVAYYDEDGARRTLDPQDYFVDADAEPAVLSPAPGRTWPATLDRAGAVEVQYSCGYGPTEASVPKPVKQYVLARVQQQFSPVSTAKDDTFDRLLDSYWVYA